MRVKRGSVIVGSILLTGLVLVSVLVPQSDEVLVGSTPRSSAPIEPALRTPQGAPPRPAPAPMPTQEPRSSLTTKPTVYVVGNTDQCQWAHDRCKQLGVTVACCGDAAFDKWIPKQPGFTLIVASIAGKTCLPLEYACLLPEGELAAASASRRSGVVTRRTEGGTTVYVVFGADRSALDAEFRAFHLSERDAGGER